MPRYLRKEHAHNPNDNSNIHHIFVLLLIFFVLLSLEAQTITAMFTESKITDLFYMSDISVSFFDVMTEYNLDRGDQHTAFFLIFSSNSR